jgi:membrane-bound serine protease (ClpP class)
MKWCWLVLWLGSGVFLGAEIAPKLVYVIPLRDDVEQTMVYLTRRGVKEAIEQKADALLLHLDTNGGRVDCTEDIIKALEKFPYPEKTYTLIDVKALSAGAFLAASTRHIYMTPGSVIGAATPVLVTPGGSGPEKLSESYEAKITSAIQAMVRSNAEKNGHNPKVFDAMVDRNSGLVVEGVEILPKGKILTLTNLEAEKTYGKPARPLLSSGTVANLEALVKIAGGEGARTMQLTPSGFESVARFFTMIAPFLLTVGLVLGYLEFKTPGFGLFGIGAALCFVVFFFGHYVAGLSGLEPMILFFCGVALIAIEAFFFPGLILPTLVGVSLIAVTVLLSMVDRYPNDALLPTGQQLEGPLANIAFAIGMTALAALLLARFLPQRLMSAKLEQTTVHGAQLPSSAIVSEGATGIVIATLRPAGSARIGDKLIDVVSDGRLIEVGATVRVAAVEGLRVVVLPV